MLEIISNQKPSPMSCPAVDEISSSLSETRSCVSASLRPAQSPAAAGRWKGHPVARAAVRPAAPVRLGRGSEPLCLISTERRPSSRRRQAPALGLMYNPNDDPDVTSGLCDDAKKEMTHPGPSERRGHRARAG